MTKLTTGKMAGDKMIYNIVDTGFAIVVQKVDGCFYATLLSGGKAILMHVWRTSSHQKAARGFFKSTEVQRVLWSSVEAELVYQEYFTVRAG